MSNFDTARDALEMSLGSEGSALEEHAKYAESLEFKLNSLKASWQSFAQTFMDSDVLKVGIDALSGLVNILEKLVDTVGLLGTIGLGVAGKGLWSYFKGAKEAKATLNDVVKAIRETSNATKEGSAVSVVSDQAEAAASEQAANAEMEEVVANETSAQSENKESAANAASTVSEQAEATASIDSANTELAEAEANATSTTTELAEAEANATSTTTELAEAEANATSTASELKEATSSAVSAEAELKEAAANTTSTATEAAEATANLSSVTTEAAESATKAANGFKAFASSLGGKLAIIGIAISIISALVQAYKNYKEEISQARQETIRASDEFLGSARSFEQAYIKYSGRTNLTSEEEAELASAINSTVDALGDKSSALQHAVNSSNDYITSLETIAKAEIRAAEAAAKNKRDNAELELQDIGSHITLRKDTSEDDLDQTNTAIKIAKEVAGDYYSKNEYGYRVSKYRYDLNRNSNEISDVLDYYHMLQEYQDRLSDEELIDTEIYNRVTAVINEMSDAVETYESGVYEAAKAQYQLAEGIPKTASEYLKMREAILSSVDIKDLPLETKNIIANSLDSEYKSMFDLSSVEFQARKLIGLIDGYGDGTKDGTNEIGTVETFLNMRTMVNDNECSVGEYLAQFDEIDKMTADWSDEEKELLNTSFGLDTDGIKAQYDEITQYLLRQVEYRKRDTANNESVSDYKHYRIEVEKNSKADIEEFLQSLTADELAAVIDIRTEIDWGNTSAEDIRKQIEDQVKLNEALNYTIAIDVEAESVEALNTAIAESVSATGLSSESITALKGRYADLETEGYNLSAMFEETSNGIHLNRREVKKLEKAYANDKLSETNEQLGVLKDRYDELATEIKECGDANDRADLYKEQKDIVDKINNLSTLAAQYKGLTSAYNEWLSVEESGSERDMYENLIDGLENIDDEISRGWLDDGTIEFLELLTGRTDLATLSAKELKEVYKGLDTNIKNTTHSIRDFFTVDDDGNSTSQGVYNFLDAIGQLEEEEFGGKDVVKRNSDGKIIKFDLELAGGEKAYCH